MNLLSVMLMLLASCFYVFVLLEAVIFLIKSLEQAYNRPWTFVRFLVLILYFEIGTFLWVIGAQ